MRRSAPLFRTTAGRLAVEVYRDPAHAASAAATLCLRQLRRTISARGSARIAFGGDPAPAAVFAHLILRARAGRPLPWSAVQVVPLEEFEGLEPADPRSAAARLHAQFPHALPAPHFVPLPLPDPPGAAIPDEFTPLRAGERLDLVCLEVGDQGRLGFNLPTVADFADPATVKRVALPPGLRAAGRDDSRHLPLAPAPSHGRTLSLPVLRSAHRLVALACGADRATLVRAVVQSPITTACPATMLRLHPQACLMLDLSSSTLAFPSLA
ncbi:MAG: 6-phosphogluconolactonase [Verrucomicrobia bacterium]|nr:6-phosphogluconolactonase [Verrucomicrobiota bacterium]